MNARKSTVTVAVVLGLTQLCLGRSAPVSPDGVIPPPAAPSGGIIAPDAGAEWYVATTGDDTTGDGSAGNPWKTIQHAVNHASVANGDIIHVAAGTYNERVTISKSLELRGAQYNVTPTPAGARTTPANESIITEAGLGTPNPDVLIEIPSGTSSVTLDGFTLVGDPTNATADTCVVRCWTNNIAIRNNIFDGRLGVLYKGPGSGLTVHRNRMIVNKNGIVLQPNSSTGCTISENTFARGTSPAGDESAIYMTSCTNTRVSGNQASGFITNSGLAGSNLGQLTICGNSFTGNKKGINIWGSSTFITIANNTLANSIQHGINIKGADISILGNVITGNAGDGIQIDYHVITTERVAVHYNRLTGNTGLGVNVIAAVTATVDAEKNWWGTLDASIVAGMVSGAIDYDPVLPTSQIHLAFAGARLVQTQNPDGGWGWPLTGSSAPNTIAPIAMGLAKAYRATGDAAMQTALQQAGAYLLTKTYNFSPSDGYLAAELDAVLGVTTHVAHLNTNYYGPLAAGTYNRNGAGTLYGTAAYVNLIRTSRASQGIPNLAAWDVAMGLVGAASCGVSGSELDTWVQGVKGEIDELDGDQYYDVIGLAGALYALALVGEEFDPTAGEHAAAGNLNDLAAILAGYQITESGGFAWNSNYVIPYDYNETIQETAYAILALNEFSGYRSAIASAIQYMNSVQLCTGGWENYVGSSSGENNEITAESDWGASVGNRLELDVPVASLYVKTGESVVIDMDVLNLLQKVNGCQAVLGFSSTYLSATAGCVVAGGGAWDQLIYNSWDVGSGVPGEIDTAIGVDAQGAVGTDADGRVAIITLTAGSMGGTTQVVFRPDVSDVESTFLSDMNALPVWPNKQNSQMIVIDGAAPTINIASAKQGGVELLISLSSTTNAVEGTVTIQVTAGDALAGLDGNPAVTVTPNGGSAESATFVNESPAGTFNYTWTITSSTPNGIATINATVSDKAGNTASDSDTFNINKHEITGTVELESLNPPTGGITRTVTFVATGGTTKTWSIPVSFATGSATGTYLLTDVPAGTTNLSAKAAWNLRKKLAVSYTDDRATVNFTGGSKLLGGDINGSNSVNILDYSVLKLNWGPAADPGNVANINGDALGVQLLDYSIMKANWFKVGDAQ